ncbi:molybdate ABC transporter substrate-binding protein [Bartonella sp. HY329]|uniref:molybdate ABC transporter substrate-binding protein n=1 Tax=unclassified Bartonella TaxID=2645622 RepID=UPI0021C72508|nr:MULTISPECIES: molybdate ABC transporter substrate-binding protein [unclassified Bartonella]UXM94604.1 molybdate ABC transporter substrate-binding protein [Bartonella sp. HY329]UXN08927.1 molybdate ABC transporter substrate-binding protein [Bartonella sp. HY328]
MQKQHIEIYAAGSLNSCFNAIKDKWQQQLDNAQLAFRFGPAGLLYQEIVNGERPDIFCSANKAWPQSLFEAGLTSEPTHFINNRLCCTVLKDSNIDENNLIESFMQLDLKIGISTPKADPGGDYALEVFKNFEKLYKGSFERLLKQAQMLVGGALINEANIGLKKTLFDSLIHRQSDIIIGYYSNAKQQCELNTAFRLIELPTALAVNARYYMAMMNPTTKAAQQFSNYLLAPETHKIFKDFGFSIV